MDLFIDQPKLVFEKTSMTAQVDEDPSQWARKVITELFRQEPATSEYTPKVIFSKVDDERGFGLGVVIISNSSDSALSTIRPNAVSKRVFVPVLIKDHMLFPLDLIMTAKGKLLPLNTHRLKQGLFRPETFEMVTDDWGDTTLYNMFYPPGRSDNDFGAGISQGVGGGTAGAVTMIQGPGMKLSSEDYPLLSEIGQTMTALDLAKVARDVESTSGLLGAASVNPDFLGALDKLASFEGEARGGTSSLVKAAVDQAPTHVVQVGFSQPHGAYWAKTASRTAFYHDDPVLLDRGQLIKWAGEKLALKVDTEGTTTVSAGKVDANGETVEESHYKTIEHPGIYKVKTRNGQELTGWVLPGLIDTDGTRTPLTIFSNGSQTQVQDEICGAWIASGVDLPYAEPAPGRKGLFYCAGPAGIMATTPVTIEGMEGEMDGGDSILVTSMLGENSKIRLVPGLKKLVASGNEFMMPSSARFMQIDDESSVALCSSPEEMGKTSAAMLTPKAVLYGGDAVEVSLRFEHMPKLASQYGTTVDHAEAVFALCAGGLDSRSALTKVAEAATGRTVTVSGLEDVVLAADVMTEARQKVAASSAAVLALRQELIKEAAVLPDAMTIDAVLSLGFINTENVRMFVSRLPYLEKCLNHVCELLLASRLGLSEVPENPTARAARALDDVIQGLRALALRKVEEDGPGA
jgi:hypothetical protein